MAFVIVVSALLALGLTNISIPSNNLGTSAISASLSAAFISVRAKIESIIASSVCTTSPPVAS